MCILFVMEWQAFWIYNTKPDSHSAESEFSARLCKLSGPNSDQIWLTSQSTHQAKHCLSDTSQSHSDFISTACKFSFVLLISLILWETTLSHWLKCQTVSVARAKKQANNHRSNQSDIHRLTGPKQLIEISCINATLRKCWPLPTMLAHLSISRHATLWPVMPIPQTISSQTGHDIDARRSRDVSHRWSLGLQYNPVLLFWR